MDLIDAYIYEVTRRIAKNKRDTVGLELKSTIEDMLPDNYSELEVKEVLLKLGNPSQLAVNYQDGPKYLIGPEMYHSYIQTIKLVIPWAIIITIIVHLVKGILFPGEAVFLSTIIQAFSITIANIIEVIFQVLFWITIVFIVMERYGDTKFQRPFIKESQAWTPEDLKNVKITPKDNIIPLSDIILSFLGLAIFTFFYFNAAQLIGIYSSDERNGLKFIMPIFNQDVLLSFRPIFIMCVILSIALTIYKWRVRQWTMPMAISSAILQCIGTVVFIVMANQPGFIHSAAIPYMAAILETTSTKIVFSIDRILLVCIALTIVASAFDIYSGFKKAKIR